MEIRFLSEKLGLCDCLIKTLMDMFPIPFQPILAELYLYRLISHWL